MREPDPITLNLLLKAASTDHRAIKKQLAGLKRDQKSLNKAENNEDTIALRIQISKSISALTLRRQQVATHIIELNQLIEAQGDENPTNKNEALTALLNKIKGEE